MTIWPRLARPWNSMPANGEPASTAPWILFTPVIVPAAPGLPQKSQGLSLGSILWMLYRSRACRCCRKGTISICQHKKRKPALIPGPNSNQKVGVISQIESLSKDATTAFFPRPLCDDLLQHSGFYSNRLRKNLQARPTPKTSVADSRYAWKPFLWVAVGGREAVEKMSDSVKWLFADRALALLTREFRVLFF